VKETDLKNLARNFPQLYMYVNKKKQILPKSKKKNFPTSFSESQDKKLQEKKKENPMG